MPKRRYTTSLSDQLAARFDQRLAEMGIDSPEALRQAVTLWLEWSRRALACPPRVAHDTPQTRTPASGPPEVVSSVSPTTRPRHANQLSSGRPDDKTSDKTAGSQGGTWTEEEGPLWGPDLEVAVEERLRQKRERGRTPIRDEAALRKVIRRELGADPTRARRYQHQALERSAREAERGAAEREKLEGDLAHAEQVVAERPEDAHAHERLARLQARVGQVAQEKALPCPSGAPGSTRREPGGSRAESGRAKRQRAR